MANGRSTYLEFGTSGDESALGDVNALVANIEVILERTGWRSWRANELSSCPGQRTVTGICGKRLAGVKTRGSLPRYHD
jgi:hypothetical protein